MKLRILLVAVLWCASCGVQEQDGYLIGRRCSETEAEPCDEEQSCLPHDVRGEGFDDYRCRDEDSFRRIEFPDSTSSEAPLAYCNETLLCPGRTVCAVDRVREGHDGGIRRTVCQFEDTVPNRSVDGGT